jgi:hypothetical protein
MVILYRRRSALPCGPPDVLLVSFGFALAGLFHIQAPLRQYYMSLLPQLCIAAAVALLALHRGWVERTSRPGASTARSALLLTAMLAATVAPALLKTLDQYGTQDGQRRRLSKVLELTRPGERVFDCWNGAYLSRLPAFYFFYLNYDIQPIVPHERLSGELPRRLLAPDVRLAIWDPHCAALPVSVHAVVARHYREVEGFPLLRVRRNDERPDEGGSLHRE